MRFPLQVLTFRRLGGRVVEELPFEVQDQEDDSAITVYTTEAGGTELADLETDANGHPAGGWVESGSYYASSPDGAFADQLFEAVTARDLGGQVVGYAYRETNAVVSSSGYADVAELTLTFTVGIQPVIVEGGFPFVGHDSATASPKQYIRDLAVGDAGVKDFVQHRMSVAGAGGEIGLRRLFEYIPAGTGEVTRKISLNRGSATTATFYAAPEYRAFIIARTG